MQLAARQERRRRSSPRSTRDRTIAAIHITWKKIRRDLRDAEESREQRLAFMVGVLNLRRPIASSRDLTDRQLGKVLDRMRELERQPELPGAQTIHAVTAEESANTGAEIIHLATAAQVATIEKLLVHLGWSPEAQAGFIQKRFQRTSPRLLTPTQANSLTMILLNIAAAKAIREREDVMRVTRTMIRVEIPQLKRRLGIDQKLVVERKDYDE
jgi:hypothetical protein